MKRFRRILLYTMTAIALVLLVATAGMWIRSKYATDRTSFSGFQYKFTTTSDSSGLLLRIDALNPSSIPLLANTGIAMSGGITLQTQPGNITLNATAIELTQIRYEGYGLHLLTGLTQNSAPSGPVTRRLDELMVSYADLTIASAILFLITGYFLLRNRVKHPQGHCQKCGYDLRATPERCPECGAIPENLKSPLGAG